MPEMRTWSFESPAVDRCGVPHIRREAASIKPLRPISTVRVASGAGNEDGGHHAVLPPDCRSERQRFAANHAPYAPGRNRLIPDPLEDTRAMHSAHNNLEQFQIQSTCSSCHGPRKRATQLKPLQRRRLWSFVRLSRHVGCHLGGPPSGPREARPEDMLHARAMTIRCGSIQSETALARGSASPISNIATRQEKAVRTNSLLPERLFHLTSVR
jgi:hypothetical protein